MYACTILGVVWIELRDITWLWRYKMKPFDFNLFNGNAFLNIVILYYLLMRRDVWFANHLVCTSNCCLLVEVSVELPLGLKKELFVCPRPTDPTKFARPADFFFILFFFLLGEKNKNKHTIGKNSYKNTKILPIGLLNVQMLNIKKFRVVLLLFTDLTWLFSYCAFLIVQMSVKFKKKIKKIKIPTDRPYHFLTRYGQTNNFFSRPYGTFQVWIEWECNTELVLQIECKTLIDFFMTKCDVQLLVQFTSTWQYRLPPKNCMLYTHSYGALI